MSNPRPFDPWAFLRHALQLGEAIARDFADRPYEQYSARLDAVARELAAELKPHLPAVPADDEEPITPSWLVATGWQQAGGWVMGPATLLPLMHGRWKIMTTGPVLIEATIYIRGTLRKLIAALGLPTV